MSDKIQVVVRCRGRNRAEIAAKSPVVVELPNDEFSASEPYVTITSDPTSGLSGRPKSLPASGKTFTLDQVYGATADQALLFENVAMPLFNDFKAGLNVTILAYGQTGSGKTYSMFGDVKGEHSGIIPRVLTKLFTAVNADHMVKISCVELYKEELHDLISDETPTALQRSKLRLGVSKDTQTTMVHNLTEVNIDSCEMGFNILKRCLGKRKTSATKLNDISSRSHTIFSISLWQKLDPGSDSEQYVKSTMNLVDLAGSEDINKSGAVNERAREAGSINQSLLSLGKVISALSEGKEQRHIPYRESKLTRILESSIGGLTKTALIATISPAKVNTVETVSTLNYASKAKNIKNLPQTTLDSEILSKKVLIKDMSSQLARYQRDLFATADKEGNIKISLQTYREIGLTRLEQETVEKEKNAHIKKLEAKLQAKTQENADLQRMYTAAEARNEQLNRDAKQKDAALSEFKEKVVGYDRVISEQARQFADTEKRLRLSLDQVLAEATLFLSSSVGGLTDELEKKKLALISSLGAAAKAVDNGLTEFADLFGAERKREIDLQLQREMNISSDFEKIAHLDFNHELSTLGRIEDAAMHKTNKAFTLGTHADTISALQARMKAEQDKFQESIIAEVTHLLASKLSHIHKEAANVMSESTSSILAKGSTISADAFRCLAGERAKLSKDITSKTDRQRKDISQTQVQLVSKRNSAGIKIYEDERRKLQSGLATVTQIHSDACRTSVAVVGKCIDETKKTASAASDTFEQKLDAAKYSLAQPLSEITENNVNVPPRSPRRKHSLLSLRSPVRGESPEHKRRRSMSPAKVDPVRFPSRIPLLLHRK